MFWNSSISSFLFKNVVFINKKNRKCDCCVVVKAFMCFFLRKWKMGSSTQLEIVGVVEVDEKPSN